MADEIKKDMVIMEALEKYPKSAKVLMSQGIHCLGCIAAHGETLEQGLKAHGMDDEKIDLIIKEMNESINEESIKDNSEEE